MSMLHFWLILHLLAATVWVGGHVLLCFSILPSFLRTKNTKELLAFEGKFEKIAIPALILLVFSGIMMAYTYGVTFSTWLSFSSTIEKVVSTNLLLLLSIACLALSAQFRVIPKLEKGIDKVYEMGVHVILVTVISVTMLILGSFIRYGGI